MSGQTGLARYVFEGYSGYLIHPDTSPHSLLAVRHSAGIAPWSDTDVHAHWASAEYYLLLRGAFCLWVAGSTLTLKPGEMLGIQPGVPHAITGGEGLIEHFGFRAPAPDDRQALGLIPDHRSLPVDEHPRELRRDWGCRIPLEEAHNQNCWLIGLGAARFHSPDFLFAYLNFPTHEAANAGLGTRHRLHLHRYSWEYYIVLAGNKTLQIEDEQDIIRPGEMLEVFPGVRHTLSGRQAPFRGFTFRVPLLDDKVEI